MRVWKMHLVVAAAFAVSAGISAADSLDEQIAKVRAGETIDPKEFKQAYNEVVERYRAARAQYYLSQVKWSLIDRKKQGGWPYRSDLLMESPESIYKGLKSIVSETGDPVARYAFVLPALYLKNDHEAEEQIAFLREHDEFLYSRLHSVLPYARVGLERLKKHGEELEDQKKQLEQKEIRDEANQSAPSTSKGEPQVLQVRRWPVQVLSAIYGTAGKDADVTGKVKEHVETFQRKFAANPKDLGTDPNLGWNKSLRIIYMKDGARREQRRNENEHILPESFYGPQDVAELRSWLPGTRWLGEQPEIQFHADQTFTSPRHLGINRWEVVDAKKIRLLWEDGRKGEFVFDHTWSSFSEIENGKNVYHVIK